MSPTFAIALVLSGPIGYEERSQPVTPNMLRQDFCADAPMESSTATEELTERAELQNRIGQHREAKRTLCTLLARDNADRLALLQTLRQTFIEAHESTGFATLLAALTTELMAYARDDPRPDRQAEKLAAERLNELAVLDPNHPELALLQTRLRGSPRDGASDVSNLDRARSLLGIVVLLGVALALSLDRTKIRGRTVLWGLGLQGIFALVILKSSPGQYVFDVARGGILRILSFADQGADLVFGNLVRGLAPRGLEGPLRVVDATSGDLVDLGLVVAVHVLPTIIFFGALMSVLYHLGIVQRLVRMIAWIMRRTMGTSGSESLSAASNIFVGPTEAPLVIKSYLMAMTRSELMALMCSGFATVSGGVLAAYTRFGADPGHLLAASVMSAPAALVIAKIMIPELETSPTAAGAGCDPERTTSNVIDAAASGTTDGLKLAANVGAMLIAFTALIALLNSLLATIGSWVGLDGFELKDILGTLFFPLAWCMGVDVPDLKNFGNLLGIKISINELVAFAELGAVRHQMSERSFTMATYALTGFANFSTIGIQIGGIAAIAPTRRHDLASLGPRAMIGGALASWITACIAGLLL